MECVIYLIRELKSSTGDRLEQAIAQTVDDLAETMEDIGEVYIVVRLGIEIGFFEYHNNQTDLEEEGLEHFRGCISLTQDDEIHGRPSVVLSHKPNNSEPLCLEKNIASTATDKTPNLRLEASNYKTPCIFDLNIHQQEINFLLHRPQKLHRQLLKIHRRVPRNAMLGAKLSFSLSLGPDAAGRH